MVLIPGCVSESPRIFFLNVYDLHLPLEILIQATGWLFVLTLLFKGSTGDPDEWLGLKAIAPN